MPLIQLKHRYLKAREILSIIADVMALPGYQQSLILQLFLSWIIHI